LAAALLESDRRYFELGARGERIRAARLVVMPQLEAVPGACVVQRVCDVEFDVDPRRWVADVVERLGGLGCTVARVYLDGPFFSLEAALADAGFERRVEVGYIVRGVLPVGRDDVVLRAVVDDDGWETKRRLHSDADYVADGYPLSGPSWVALERRKCDSGGMRAYLVEIGGTAVGAVAALEVDGLLRAKNVFVRSEYRRQGVGAAAMGLLSRRAVELGAAATGIFGVEGRPGNALYRRLGMTPVVEQQEWARYLVPGNGNGDG
jgi:GNAT superfamily N-acetyltransferase